MGRSSRSDVIRSSHFLRLYKEGDKIYTLKQAVEKYGIESLVPISSIKQLIFYTSHGIQPECIGESEKETGKIVAWFHKNKTYEIYKQWQSTKPI